MGRKRVDPANRKYKDPGERVKQFIDVGYTIAAEQGLGTLTLSAVATECNVTQPLVSRYCGNLAGLRVAVLDRGIVAMNADIVADAIELKMVHMAKVVVPAKLMAAARKILSDAHIAYATA